MADAVQERIEREQRFASDVSHELRSPITALTAAVEVLDGRRADLPERTQQALDVVVSQVRRFDSMVIDLLELSRLDAGASDMNVEEVDLVDLCDRVSQRYGYDELPDRGAPPCEAQGAGRPGPVRTDPRQPARQRHHARRRAEADHDRTVPRPQVGAAVGRGRGAGRRGQRTHPHLRALRRGSAARHRVGTGLGLALVAEHAAALGGEAWVEDRPGGGARFVVRLPTESP